MLCYNSPNSDMVYLGFLTVLAGHLFYHERTHEYELWTKWHTYIRPDLNFKQRNNDRGELIDLVA